MRLAAILNSRTTWAVIIMPIEVGGVDRQRAVRRAAVAQQLLFLRPRLWHFIDQAHIPSQTCSKSPRSVVVPNG